MKQLFKNNLAIKIFALLAAILLWLYVQMVQNVDIDYVFSDMKVNLVNTSVLEESNLTIINEEDFKADITIKCPRWSLNSTKKEDFVVYVDLSEIKKPGIAELPVKVRINNENIIVSKKFPSTVKLNIDKIVTVEKKIDIHLSGIPKDGFYTNDKLVTPETTVVSVKGPKSIVNKVAGGIINIDINNKSNDFSNVYDVILVDKEGTAVSNDKLKVLGGSVNVSVKFYEKKIVPVTIRDIPSDISYEIKPAGVEITGPKESIEKIENIVVQRVHLGSTEPGYIAELNLNLPDDIIVLSDVMPKLYITEKPKGNDQ